MVFFIVDNIAEGITVKVQAIWLLLNIGTFNKLKNMVKELAGFVSVLHDLQTVPPRHDDLGFCPDLVKMNVKPIQTSTFT